MMLKWKNSFQIVHQTHLEHIWPHSLYLSLTLFVILWNRKIITSKNHICTELKSRGETQKRRTMFNREKKNNVVQTMPCHTIPYISYDGLFHFSLAHSFSEFVLPLNFGMKLVFFLFVENSYDIKRSLLFEHIYTLKFEKMYTKEEK